MKDKQYKITIIILLSIFYIFCENSLCISKTKNDIKYFKIYIEEIAKFKVDFERITYDLKYFKGNNKNKTNLKDSLLFYKNRYKTKLDYMKSHKEYFLKMISKYKIIIKNNKSIKIINFQYKSFLSSYIGKCTYLNYKQYLDILEDYLINDRNALICEDKIEESIIENVKKIQKNNAINFRKLLNYLTSLTYFKIYTFYIYK